MPSFQSEIEAGAARTILDALTEIGNETARMNFLAAVAWEETAPPLAMLRIEVTPLVTAALTEIGASGQLVSFIGGNISPQSVLALTLEWQKVLSSVPRLPRS